MLCPRIFSRTVSTPFRFLTSTAFSLRYETKFESSLARNRWCDRTITNSGGGETGRRVVRVGCGAGYQGDRIPPAVQLMKNGDLDYMFLECLAERTLAIAHKRMRSGGTGYDPRLKDWLRALLPLAVEQKVRLVTNMGAADPVGAGKVAAKLVEELGLPALRIVCCGERFDDQVQEDGSSAYAYLGAEVVVHALSQDADLVILGRVADPSMLVGIVAFEHGWSLAGHSDFDKIARATVAGHLLECGFHLTGGYFAHPEGRDLQDGDFESLADLSMPFADVGTEGEVVLRKLDGSRGELSVRTCTQQLLYEVGNPEAYVTPDISANFTHVSFWPLSEHAVEVTGAVASAGPPTTLLQLQAREAGMKLYMEASMGGRGALKRAHWADCLVRRWMEEERPGSQEGMLTYFLGWNSLYLRPVSTQQIPVESGAIEPPEVRIRWDGIFATHEDANALVTAASGLALGGPAGLGGVFSNPQPTANILITKELVDRSSVSWVAQSFGAATATIHFQGRDAARTSAMTLNGILAKPAAGSSVPFRFPNRYVPPDVAPRQPVVLYDICHSRAGDKGNTSNVSLIPYDPADFSRLAEVITDEWAASIFKPLLDTATARKLTAKVYELEGTRALNIVVFPVLDGGVSVSRRIDVHGKSLSDMVLAQEIIFKSPRLD